MSTEQKKKKNSICPENNSSELKKQQKARAQAKVLTLPIKEAKDMMDHY